MLSVKDDKTLKQTQFPFERMGAGAGMPAVCPQEWTSAENSSVFSCSGKNQSVCVVLEEGGIWSCLVKVSLSNYCIRVFFPTCKSGLVGGGGKKRQVGISVLPFVCSKAACSLCVPPSHVLTQLQGN